MKLPEAERLIYERYQDDRHQQASMVKSSYGWGMRQGRKLGCEEGQRQGPMWLLLKLLRQRFGEPPAWVVERLAGARPEQLERWGERLLDASTSEAVFQESSEPGNRHE